MKKIFSIFLSALCLHGSAQNQEDIFRYSNQSITGSARSLGLSGAWGAAGADLSSASFNPAGLGLYRRNEWMGAMAITNTRSKTTFAGNPMSDGRTMFNVPNFGMVFNVTDQYMGAQQKKGVVGVSLAFGMNRLNDYQTNTQYAGNMHNATMATSLAQMANGSNCNDFLGKDYNSDIPALAWRTYMIDTIGTNNTYISSMAKQGDTAYTMQVFNQIQTRGRMNEWYVGGGMNVSNFLYLGGSLVIDHSVYTSENVYSETLLASSIANNYIKSARVNQNLETRGTGVGGKFGFILRPTEFLRIGASYHTPVRMNMKDMYNNSVTMTFTNSPTLSEPGNNDKTEYKYQIVTPERITASGALIVGKIMVLAADYERIDYTRGRLQSTDGSTNFVTANQNNSKYYGVAQNYKAGVEICGKYTRYRLGYAILGSPYQEAYVSKADGTKQLISAGFGWVYDNSYFFDIAVSDRIGKDFITPFEGAPITALNETHKLNFVFGMGHRF